MSCKNLINLSILFIVMCFLSVLNEAIAQDNSTIVCRFAVASDGHYGQPNTSFKMYHRDIVRWLNQEKAQSRLDVAFFNGDMIHDDPKFLPEVKEVLYALDMPYYSTRGNHDRVSTQVWQQNWGYPTNHSLIINNIGFILGDTSDEEGAYLCASVSWLQEALDDMKHLDHVFVLLHIAQSKWTTNGVDCPEVMNLLSQTTNVKGVFHGHDHDEDDVKIYQQTPFLFDGHIGGSWGVEYKGFRIVEVHEDGKVLTYQVNPNANAKVYEQQLH